MSDPTPPRSVAVTVAVVVVLLLLLIGGLALCLGGTAFFGMFSAIAIPNFVSMQLKAKRAEVPGNVDGIATAELSYDAAFDTYVPVGSREAAEAALRASGGKQLRTWDGGPDWEKLGWMPDGPVRGAYWVEVSKDGASFSVHGICDVDGDGEYAEYVYDDRYSHMVSGPNVY